MTSDSNALIDDVTATANKHGNLHEMMSQEARTLAEAAKLDTAENADGHGYYMYFATYVRPALL